MHFARFIVAGRINADPALAAELGPVHGAVRALGDGIDVLCLAAKVGDADAGPDGGALALMFVGQHYDIQNFIRHSLGPHAIGQALENHGKLVSAQPGHEVGVP